MSIELTKEETSSLKGIAIILMICLHFFCTTGNTMIAEGKVDFLFTLFRQFATHGLACLAIFSFITGYGYCALSAREPRAPFAAGLHRLRSFYPFFAFMCTLYFCLGHLFPYEGGLKPEDWSFFPKNLTGIHGTIPDYWYIRVVLVSALLYFPILLAAKRVSPRVHTWILFGLIVATYAARTADLLSPVLLSYGTNIRHIIHHGAFLALWMHFFLAGYTLRYYTESPSIGRLLLAILATAICYSQAGTSTFILIASICAIKILPSSVNAVLFFFGTYSTCMWLNHRLIFGYWFSSFFYSLPTPVNIALLILLSLATSYIITNAWHKITEGAQKKEPGNPEKPTKDKLQVTN